MKKLLCAILCLTMLLSVFLIPAGAVNLNGENVTYADNTCVKLRAPEYSTHPTWIAFGDSVSENSTITLYFQYDPATANLQQAFPLYIGSDFIADGAAMKTNYLLTGIGFELWGTCGKSINTSFDSSDKGTGATLVDGQFNRIDFSIDFDAKQTKIYLNYNLITTVDFYNQNLTSYRGIYIPYQRTMAKYAYMDNLMIRKGCVAPEKGDIASNVSIDKVVAAKDSVIFFNTFEADTLITAAVSHTAGAVCCARQGWQGWANEIISTAGLSAQKGGAQFRGVQQSAVNGTYNVRFVGTVDSANYDALGFKIALKGGKTITDCAVNVYDSIIGANGVEESVTYSAIGTYGAGYIYASTIKGLSATETYEFTVTPFTVDANGVETAYAPYTVSCVNGVVTTTAAN